MKYTKTSKVSNIEKTESIEFDSIDQLPFVIASLQYEQKKDPDYTAEQYANELILSSSPAGQYAAEQEAKRKENNS